MKKVTPELVDKVVVSFEKLTDEKIESLIQELEEHQPAALAYVLSEDFEALGEEENEILLLDALMLWQIINQAYESIDTPDSEKVDQLQFDNWKASEELKATKGQSFDDFVEPMIADYPEDELLYFVLDTLIDEDDEDDMNSESKLPIFIALKTLCDGWIL